MDEQLGDLARLYLPLLAHEYPDVQQQACIIFLSTYGNRALIHLRRLLDDTDPHIRQQAHLSLQRIGDLAGLHTELRPPRGLYVECLGHLRVQIGSRTLQLEDWIQPNGGRAGWRKVQGVFAYLIHCGRAGTSREAVSAALWGEPIGATSLSRTLTTLRQLLIQFAGQPFVDQHLIITREHIELSVEAYQTDVQFFERVYAAAGRVERTYGLVTAVPIYAQALELYGGAYFSRMPHSAEWCGERRDMLMNDWIIALERMAEHAYDQGNFQRCIWFCRQALEADPTAEDITTWLLRAYARLGRRTELEQSYRRYLRAAPDPEDEQHNIVIQTYRELVKAR